MRRLLWIATSCGALVGPGPRRPQSRLHVFGRQGIDLRPLRPLVDVVEDAYITQDSRLTKDRSVVIVTTASLPWMTGTAVNPALRAAYMVGNGYKDVTLLLPWLSDPEDQKTLFNGRVFKTQGEQEEFVREWITKNAPDAPASSLNLGWYPSRYATGLGSILNLDDMMTNIPSTKNDIVILEEPEHLNWYRNGPRWTSRFRHVVGVAHTNYEAYAIADNEGMENPTEEFNVKAERFFTETVTRAHCDVVVQLSRTLRPLPHSRVENVHGVRKCFLDVGAQGGPPAFIQKPTDARCYFVGKAMWAKGYTQLLVLKDTNDIKIDCYGGGPELTDIQNKSSVLDCGLVFKGPADHADASIFGAYDVFVNPSISEVLCTATAEALAMGKRVVIAEHPSNEFFYQFDTCYKVPPGDSEAFKRQLNDALDAAAADRVTYKPWASPNLPDALKPLTWSAATDRLVTSSALDARAPPARLALASLVMHSYHWGMTASPLALDLFLTLSGAGPHTAWSDRRDELIGSVGGVTRTDESDSKFQEILRRNLASTSRALKNANRLSKVISERLRKRDGAAQLQRRLGPTLRPRRRRKLREALPGPGVPLVAVRAEEEELAIEESLFEEEPTPPRETNWPRTQRAWRRVRGQYQLFSASWLEPRQFRERDRSLPKAIARSAACATRSLRSELASNATNTK